MARIFFLTIALWLAYKLVFDLILPVFKTTKQMHSQFKNMHDRPANPAGPQASKQEEAHTRQKARAGEYIDFEEVK